MPQPTAFVSLFCLRWGTMTEHNNAHDELCIRIFIPTIISSLCVSWLMPKYVIFMAYTFAAIHLDRFTLYGCCSSNRIHFLIVTNSCDRWHKINSSIIGLHTSPYLCIVNKSVQVCFVPINRLVRNKIRMDIGRCERFIVVHSILERHNHAIDIVCDNRHMLLAPHACN